MKKIDLTKVKVADIEGREIVLNVAKVLGNQIYMQGQSLPECEFGKTLYYSECEIEMTAEQAELVRRFVRPMPYLTRTAVEKMIEEGGL